MLTALNYQIIIDMAVTFIMISMPIGILFGITEKLIKLFLSFVFGDRTIKL